MRPSLLLPVLLAVSVASAYAQEDDASLPPEPEFHCGQKDMPEELAQLCTSFDGVWRDTMSRPVDPSGSGRPQLKSPVGRPALTHEFTGRGLAPTLSNPIRNPFDGPGDRGVGLRVRTSDTPFQLSTEMVQPGSSAETILNWELKAERGADASGLFYGAATAGTYTADGMVENISGYAGLRGIAHPADNFQLGAEITPRATLPEFDANDGSVTLEPKFTASSDFGRLGTSDFTGSLNADAVYSIPVDGDPSARGGVRFTIKPR
jgi:hypothetical protein